MSNIDRTKLVTRKQQEASSLDAARLAATITKSDFCIGLADMGIITDEECVAAAKGEWPEGAEKVNAKPEEIVSGFADFLDYLPPDKARNARTLWAATGDVMRMDGTILALAWWFNISDGKLDALFGVKPADTAP